MKNKLNIGDVVNIKASVIPTYEDRHETITNLIGQETHGKLIKSERVLKPYKRNFKGQITGGKYLRLGVYNPGYYERSYFGEEDNSEQPSLSVDRTVFVYLVRDGFLNKEHYVLPDDLELLERNTVDFKVPMSNQGQQEYYTPEYKEILRDAARDQPRDSKGRFKKYEPGNLNFDIHYLNTIASGICTHRCSIVSGIVNYHWSYGWNTPSYYGPRL